MITRDISLEDCILDLIDNSVDGAWRSEGSRPMGLEQNTDLSKYEISITASVKKFSIEDNCGGMTLDDAVNHAFSFGRRSDDAHDAYSIGVYGIGMKRAVFKLGKSIRIRSTYNGGSFAVPISVDKWLENDTPPWDFDIEEDEPLSAKGVNITVESLTSGATAAFGNPAFIQNLRRTISRDYSLHINRGLKIFLNESQIPGWQIEMLEGADFAPMRIEYADEVEGDHVSVEIIGGMVAPPPESADPDIVDEGEKRFGWYVVCNGRIVLAADKTELSGWGTDEWPQWHRQYSGFIGIVLFTAAKATALPLTTTKRSVDPSSEVFRRAKPRMREVTRKWIDYTNVRKQSLEEAKAAEGLARPVALTSVVRLAEVRLPRLAARSAQRVANVSYSVPLPKLKDLAKAFGNINMPYREVGLMSFNYSYDDKVGDE
ncbi:MAG: ATP-binding protein [Dechloromonas sp.]|nr:ATP-binding protein [Dechloromonas sp.]